MPQFIGLATLGRDAEVRHTAQGDPVASLSLAFTYGKKGTDGKRPTQWVDGSLWGPRAEALQPYLLKGTRVYVVLDDAHIEAFQRQDGSQGVKLAGRVSVIEFAAKPADRQAAPAQQQTAPPARSTQARQPQPAAATLADMDDDIPF